VTELDQLAERMRVHVARLCSVGPDRFPGTAGNRAAVAYVTEELRSAGCSVELLPFPLAGWRRGPASIVVGGQCFAAAPSPFSLPVAAEGVLAPVATARELRLVEDRHPIVLLLHGEIAACQLVPRS